MTMVGDRFVGKSSLLVSFSLDEFPRENFFCRLIESYERKLNVDGKDYSLTL
jgi:GTPase SAR1 family protein